jgi:hypothetical protein
MLPAPTASQENKKIAKYTASRRFEVLPAAGNISNPPGPSLLGKGVTDLKFQTPYFCSWDAAETGMQGITQVLKKSSDCLIKNLQILQTSTEHVASETRKRLLNYWKSWKR